LRAAETLNALTDGEIELIDTQPAVGKIGVGLGAKPRKRSSLNGALSTSLSLSLAKNRPESVRFFSRERITDMRSRRRHMVPAFDIAGFRAAPSGVPHV